MENIVRVKLTFRSRSNGRFSTFSSLSDFTSFVRLDPGADEKHKPVEIEASNSY